jgi:hypothetical protein
VTVRQTTWYTFGFATVSSALVTVPLAPLNSTWWRVGDQVNGGNFNSQLGWPQLAATIARVRDGLPASDRDKLRILARDDGETGAVNLYGPAYHLPLAISGMNSNWIRGFGDPPPQTVITLGFDRRFLEQNFESCELAAHLTDPYTLENQAINWNTEVFVCRNLRQPWPDFWEHFQTFG